MDGSRPAVAGDRPEAVCRLHGAPVADPHTGVAPSNVPLIADVIVDVDLDRFDGDIAIGMHRQWSQCRAVQLLKCVTSVTGQLRERTLVEFVQQGTDALVEFGKREEGLMA